MSAEYWNLGSADFSQDWTDKGLITANNDWSRVPGIVGFLGDYTTASPTNVDPRTLTAGTPTTVNVFANQDKPNTFNSGGVAEFDIANPTIALQGSGTADAPYLALYLNASGRQNVTLTFNARDLDGSADNAIQQLAVQYRLNDSSAWTNVYYNEDVTEGGTATKVTPVSVTLPADANDAGQLQVRIITTNAGGSDEWVGIDDIVVTSTGTGGGLTGTLGIADASVVEGDAGVQDLTFTVSRTGGSDGAVEATYTVGLPGGANGADAGDFAAGAAFTGKVSFAAGQTSATITLPVLGDQLGENNEAFTVTLSSPTGGAQLGRAVATGTILNDDVLTLLVGQIQGESHRSAYVGQAVVTTGIVTAVDSNGFYLQDAGDGNARTSDGIFVFTSTPPEVFAGDLVSVSGRVSEFVGGTGGLTVTQIVSPTIDIASYGNVLPAATLIGTGGLLPPTQTIDDDRLTTYDPATDGIDFWESLEGMRVTIDNPLVVSNTTSDFGETDVVASLGVGATGVNDRGGITISAGDYNPEKIQIDGDSAIFSDFAPNYTVGDQLSSVTGIVNYAFARYEVLVTEAVTVTKDVTLTRETTALVGDADHMSLATYNVENLDASDNKYDILAANIVYNLRAPDVIGLQEIQDANGAASGGSLSGVPTANGLIAAIAKLGYGNYKYVEIAPATANSTGGEPNGNIRNGYLYNDDRVDYVAGSATLITGSAYSNSRNPLAAQFAFNGETVFAINVHSTSRGGSDPLWGATQPPTDAGDAARTAQAAGVKAWVQDKLASDPGLNVAILGDWNGFAFENAQTQLTDPARGGVFTNLNTLLAPEERYSYLFEGNAQQLDNILVTGGLLAGASYDAVHLNSQFTGDRPTDHDPQLALLQLGNRATVGEDVFTFAEAGRAPEAVSFADTSFWTDQAGGTTSPADNVVYAAYGHEGSGGGDWMFRDHYMELHAY